jgi:uncharacterized protein
LEYSACLENAVYLLLRRLDYENIYYYKTFSGKEIDFVAQKQNGKINLYQACLNITDEKTKQREISALIESSKELQVSEAFIITSDDFEVINLENLTITIIPYWKWSLESEKIWQ